MIRFSDSEILHELEKSGKDFVALCKTHEPKFTPVPQSGKHPDADYESFAALIGDTYVLARYSKNTKNWKFRSFIFCP